MTSRLFRIFILVTLIAASCRVEAVWTIAINPEGDGVVTENLAFDDEFTRLAEDLGTGTDPRRTTIREGKLAAVSGAEVAESREDDMDVFTVTVPFANPQELGAILALPESPFSTSQISVTADEVFFRGEAGIPEVLQLSSVLRAIPGAGEEFAANLIAESVSYLVRVTLPGVVGDHNADDEPRGEVLEWQVRLHPDFLPVIVTATSDPTPPGSFPWWIFGGVGLVLLLGATAVLMAGSREREEPDPARTPADLDVPDQATE